VATNPAREPTVWQVAEAFRRDLAAREAAARREMAAAWEPVRREILRRTGELTRKIAERELAGRRVPVSWLFERDRLGEWELRVRKELAGWRKSAEGPISRAVRGAASIGPDHAMELIRRRAIPFPEPAARALVRFPHAEVEQLVATLQEGSPLAELLARTGDATAAAMREALVRNVALGRGAVEMGRELGSILDGNLARGMLIARTETMRTYREATRLSYAAQGDLLSGWRWFSTLDRRTCASCWAMTGTLHPVTERLDDHPNGRCSMIPELRDLPNAPMRTGEEAFRDLDPSEQERILGRGRFALYERGEATLADMVARPVHPRWGSMRREASITQSRANAALRHEGVARPSERPAVAAGEADPATLRRAVRREELAAELRAAREAHSAVELELGTARDALEELVQVGPIHPDYGDRYQAVQRLEAQARRALSERYAARDALTGHDNRPAALADRPSLAALGERLVVTSDPAGPVARHLDNLARLPEHTLRELADGGYTLRLDAGRRVPDFPYQGHLEGVRPRGWSEGRTWRDVGAAHSPATRDVMLGDTGMHPEDTIAAHEVGHAIARLRNLESSPAVVSAHARAYETLRARMGDYYASSGQGGPGGAGGVSETLAEGFAHVALSTAEVAEWRLGPELALLLRQLMLSPL
jgi:hypothetical protein